MSINYLILLFQMICFISPQFLFSQLNITPIYSDHMVLQQNTKNSIWGTCDCSEVKIETSWGISMKAPVIDHKWLAQFETTKFGGPHEIKVSAGNNVKIYKDVLLGEVWLASGQSNMQWTFSQRIDNKEETIKNSFNNEIRMVNIPNDLSRNPNTDYSWMISSADNLKNFSSVGYYFALSLYDSLKIPIGIINSSWGGTRIEAWMSVDTLQYFSSTSNEVKQINRVGNYQKLSLINENESQKIKQQNEIYLNKISQYVPKYIQDSISWASVNLYDDTYSKPELDDSMWSIYKPVELLNREWSSYSIAFENLYPNNEYAQGGVIWFRKKFNVEDINNDAYIIYDGIDDLDWTYINGIKIGQTLQCCGKRQYKIPKSLLRFGENLLSIRIIDFKGPGGIMGNAIFKTSNKLINLSSGEWKYKHHAFYLHPTLQLHSFEHYDLLNNFQDLEKNLHSNMPIDDPNSAGILFEKMIEPLIPYHIKGVIWYQGESNVSNYKEYEKLFPALISNWRTKWNHAFPFYYVQIAPYQYSDKQSSQNIREAQRKTLNVKKTGMVVTLDIGEEKDIHPSKKKEVGFRLSLIALKDTYGYDQLCASGPVFVNAKKTFTHIDLNFSETCGGLMKVNNLTGFEVADKNGIYHKAKAKIIENKVRLTSLNTSKPTSVRYGWSNYFEATLFNKSGLPASSFEIFLKH